MEKTKSKSTLKGRTVMQIELDREERMRAKAMAALRGINMSEYIRSVILEDTKNNMGKWAAKMSGQ